MCITIRGGVYCVGVIIFFVNLIFIMCGCGKCKSLGGENNKDHLL